MIDLYYILRVMLFSWLITFMGYHTRLKINVRLKGLMGLKGLNAGGYPLCLLYRPLA